MLARQLELTRATWARIRAHGVGEQAQLQLDFFFEAPSRARADELMRVLKQETDYDVRVVADEDRWMVRGHTQPSPVTESMLEEWVDWMVTAGLQYDCRFDGWGAELP